MNKIVSAPGSGRSWVRIVLGKLRAIKEGTSDKDLFRTEGYSFKHEYKGTGRVVFLLRDPRDVVVSGWYKHMYRMGRKKDWKEMPLSEYVRSDIGISQVIGHYNEWYAAPVNPLVVFYEDLVADPLTGFKDIFDWCEELYTKDQLRRAIKFGEFSNLQKLSKEMYFDSGFLNAGDPDNVDTWKFRKGKIGGFIEALSDEDIAFVNEKLVNCAWGAKWL